MEDLEGLCVSELEAELILVSARCGDLDLLRELRDKTDDDDAFLKNCEDSKNPEGFTCLHLAAEIGHIPMCRFLIEKVNLDVDIKTQLGDTSLLIAAAKGHFRTVKYLIIRGADVELCDSKGNTCLHLVAERGSKEVMQLLLLRGADLEAHSVAGTPLTRAARSGNVESVQFLLRRGAIPDADNPFSGPPLMGAVFGRSYECMELLLNAGATPNITSLGLSPLAVAAREKDEKLLRFLLANGSDPNLSTTDLLKPLEHAVDVGNLIGVSILFPLTERIVGYRDWSIDGIKTHFHSEEAKTQRMKKRKAFIRDLEKLGKAALRSEDYQEAVKQFNMALILQPDNDRLLRRRGICWENLHKTHFLLHDAQAFVQLKPHLPKGHCMTGQAWMSLRNFNQAYASYTVANLLDPENIEIKKLLSVAIKQFVLCEAEKNLIRTLKLLPALVPICRSLQSTLVALAKEKPTEAMDLLWLFLNSQNFHLLF